MNSTADISVLEGLQAAANAAMVGHAPISQMSVFNTQQDVKDTKAACDEFTKVLDKILQECKKYAPALAKFKTVEKQVNDRRREEAKEVAEEKRKGNPEPQKIFEREYREIMDAKAPVSDKKKELQDMQFIQ